MSLYQSRYFQFDVCTEDLFTQTIKMEEMEKKAGSAEQVSRKEQKSELVNYKGKGWLRVAT